MNLEKLSIIQIKKAATIFARAMMNDDLHVFFFPDKASRFEKLKSLYEYKLNIQYRNCFATSVNLEGFAIWEAPGEQHSPPGLIFLLLSVTTLALLIAV